MKEFTPGSYFRRILFAFLASAAVINVNAAVTILSTEYKPDQVYPEWNCFWNSGCANPNVGVTIRVQVKNTGASTATIDDVYLAGYSLKTVIARPTDQYLNPAGLNSIYFYWDDPPQAILDAGEPVYYKIEPSSLPAGRAAQITLRLRNVPVTLPVNLTIVTSAGNVATNVAASTASTPRLASIGYSEDLTKIYIHWRRQGGAVPASVWLDGTNVTGLTTTVGDPSMNFASSVITLPSPLPYFSYHVYQGFYGDGSVAAAGQRAWTNKFIYSTYCKFESDDCDTWLTKAVQHGVNNIQMNLCGMCLGTASTTAVGYGYTIMGLDKLNSTDPDMWFLDDEPDLAEDNQVNGHCGTGLRIPCEGNHRVGTLVMRRLDDAVTLRNSRPNVPITVNLDGGLEPESFYTWGPAMDILQTDNYYEPRMNSGKPIFSKATFSYAVARTACTGAEPNPSNHLLYSTRQTIYPTPASKRMEAYYSLAGGSKGMGYWWFKSPNGLQDTSEGAPLWREIGLIGNEIKTARNLIVKSTPVDLPLVPSTNVWVRGVASGADTFILYVVNDNYYNDSIGCHYSIVSNATVTVTLPSWMVSPASFEITAGGLRDLVTVLNGNQLKIHLGALVLTRMIVLTTDGALRGTVQSRYDSVVKANVCAFASDQCVNSKPTITQQPVNRSAPPAGTTNLITVATGPGSLNYQWQKNNANLSNGGHYAGANTGILTISSADNNDVASYRCIIANAYGSVTSSVVNLSIVDFPSAPVANAATSITDTTFVANWSSGAGATGYILDVSTNNSFSSFVSGYNGLDVGNVLSKNVTGLVGSTTYYYRVRSRNDVGQSGNSGTITVTTAVTIYPPAAPTATAASGIFDTGFTANWESSSGAIGYRLDVSTDGNFGNFLAGYNNLDVGNTLNRSLTSLTTGATYYYRVRGYNSAGSGSNSATIAVTLAVGDPCIQVANRDFESGFIQIGGGYIGNGWNEWETDPSGIIGFDEPTIVRGGAHSQRVKLYGGASGTSGGVYQRIPVVAGQAFTVGAWTYSGDNLTTCYLGVDPSGGTNANAAGVIWSVGTTNVAWVHKTLSSTATASYVTLFFKAANMDSVRRNAYFDDAIPDVCANSAPSITQQPNDQNVVVGGVANFTVAAGGTTPLYYQWLKNGENLTDGGHYSGSTAVTLTVSGVSNDDVADYRCIVTNDFGSTNSDVASLNLITPNPCIPILNPDFENGFSLAGGGNIGNDWKEWEASPGVVIGYDEAAIIHSGAHSQRIRVWGATNATSGGVYQRIPVTSGQPYMASVWAYAEAPLTTCYLGVDPAGGTNAASGVTWSAGTTNAAWAQQSWTGLATANYITVFYKVASGDNNQRNGYFDDASPHGSGGPFQLAAQGDGGGLTLTWPECPNAHLEWTSDLTSQNWTTATNQVSLVGGQKTVTVTPSQATGFFRLVQE